MRRKQWAVSLLLFLVSLAFLVYSKNIFPAKPGQEKTATALPQASVSDTDVVVLANEDYYPVLRDHFRNAKTKILGTVFLFKTAPYRDNEPTDLLHELIVARKRNVDVTLVMELSSETKEYNDANRYAADMLRKNGVTVRIDDETVTTHAKTFVIDDRYCFVGSHNFTHAAMSMNQELSLFVDSPDLAEKISRFVNQVPLSRNQ